MKSLAIMFPGRHERSKILDGMERTFVLREKLRDGMVLISTFISKFPRLLYYGGEIVREEFRRMYPSRNDICGEWLRVSPRF